MAGMKKCGAYSYSLLFIIIHSSNTLLKGTKHCRQKFLCSNHSVRKSSGKVPVSSPTKHSTVLRDPTSLQGSPGNLWVKIVQNTVIKIRLVSLFS